jgi:glycerate-2-kinase
MGFEHRIVTLGLRGEVRNVARIVANLAQNMLELMRLP